MKKYIYLAFTIVCLIFIYDALFNAGEVVGIETAIYNRETGKITFQVSHTIGCGSYYNYEYNLIEKDFSKKEAIFNIILKTDNRCEGFALNNDLEMELPNLPFKPLRLIFKGGYSKNGDSDVIVNIP
ncbi:MAG: hypothetical protein SWZ49_14000 [Cyanobacteriota bacterium]|nr:hypothetical protein [Cyanobacteriota bacterium]